MAYPKNFKNMILKEIKSIVKKYPNSIKTPKKTMERYYKLQDIWRDIELTEREI